MAVRPFRTLPPTLPFTAETMRQIAEVVRQTAQAKFNCALTLTFTTSTSFTTLQDPRIGPHSVLVFNPLTENAAADQATIYTTSQSAQVSVVHHSISSNADRIYRVGIFA